MVTCAILAALCKNCREFKSNACKNCTCNHSFTYNKNVHKLWDVGETQRTQNVNAVDYGPPNLESCCTFLIMGAILLNDGTEAGISAERCCQRFPVISMRNFVQTSHDKELKASYGSKARPIESPLTTLQYLPIQSFTISAAVFPEVHPMSHYDPPNGG